MQELLVGTINGTMYNGTGGVQWYMHLSIMGGEEGLGKGSDIGHVLQVNELLPKIIVRRKNISEHKTQRNGLLHNFPLCLRCRDGKICVTSMGAKAMGQWGNATSMGGNDGVCTKPGGGLKSSLFCWSSLCHLSVRTKRCSIENLLIAYLPFDF